MLTVDIFVIGLIYLLLIHALEVHDSFGVQDASNVSFLEYGSKVKISCTKQGTHPQ